MAMIKVIINKFINFLDRGQGVCNSPAKHEKNKPMVSPDKNQKPLILFVTLPCIFITFISLILADISPYLIAFIMIVLSLIGAYVVVASEQRAEYQIRTLSNIIESMIGGDYSLRGRLQTNQAFQELLNSVNTLADTLSRHKIEAKQSRQLLERIMEQMDAMVLAVDEKGLLVMANASAKKLLFDNIEDIENLELAKQPIGKIILNSAGGLIDISPDEKQPVLHGEHFLVKEQFLSDGKAHQLYLLTSAERLLIEKERQAWQSLLRVLSHEMNNSLTPISAISQSMKQKLSKPETEVNRQSLLTGVDIINERAGSLTSFISHFSQLSHLPLPIKSHFQLEQLLTHTKALFPDYCFDFAFNVDESESIDSYSLTNLWVDADKSQLEQVFINLFKNAIESMDVAKTNERDIALSIKQDSKWLHITVIDQGQGIANKDNLFVPFYSTKSQGSGIGLCLCRQILFNHGGTIELNNNTSGVGANAVVSLPLKQG